MKNRPLLPLTLLILGISANSHAEQISLPNISVEGVSREVTPYTLPALSASTADLGDMVKRLPGTGRNGYINVSVNF